MKIAMVGRWVAVFGTGLIVLGCMPAMMRGQGVYSTPYAITTLAGVSPGAADATGSAARFSGPRGVAVDGAGNLYVADSNNNTIRKITPAGVVTTLAGTAGVPGGNADGAGSAARFSSPTGVAVDGAGTVYVADSGNNEIRKITSAGVVTTLAGSTGTSGNVDGAGSAARFAHPQAVAVDSAGNLYVADGDNNTIRKVTPAGAVTTLAGSAGASGSADGTGSAARFSSPAGVAVDSAGNVYVADTNNHAVRMITPAGAVTTLSAQFSGLYGVAVDSAGTVYAADTRNNKISKVTQAGVVTLLAGAVTTGSADGTGSLARFNSPKGVAVDGAGNVYVADSDNDTIRTITPSGAVTTLAGLASPGGVDGTGSLARFYNVAGVAVDSAGNIYVADSLNNTIRKATPAGVVTTLAGDPSGASGVTDGTGSGARFSSPWEVAVDSNGIVYVADQYSHTIRKVTPAGVVTTLAGTGGLAGNADGTGPAARFNFPYGVAVDGAGNVYVADTNNHTLRKITSAGVVTTLAGFAGVSGSADGTGSAARFNGPRGVAVDSTGMIYVSDSGNGTIRVVTPAGVVTTLAGAAGISGSADGTGSAAQFFFPDGIAVDSAGVLYVADSNRTIRKVTPAGVVTTLAGVAGLAGGVDGTGSVARFNQPAGVAVSGAGALYIGDGLNNTIRVGVAATGPVPPYITSQPLSQAVVTGSAVTFTVSAGGASPLAYQWNFNGTAISGATAASYAISSAAAGNAGTYTVTVTNTAGSATSTVANLTVNSAAAVPTITSQPASQTVAAGAGVSFTVSASSTSPLTYQWNFNGTAISGATSGVYTVFPAATSSAGSYSVTVTNSVGSVTSAIATLTVTAAPVAPVITRPPSAQTAVVGSAVSFAVSANGASPLAYQWNFNGTPIPGATAATYTISSVAIANAGPYNVTVTNSVGSAFSSAVVLSVRSAQPPSITLQPASQTFIVGNAVSFTVSASGTAPLTYQWKFNGTPINGATSSSYAISSATTANSGSYTVVVTNSGGSVTSNAATLADAASAVAPSITTQPSSQTVTAGAPVTFTVTASGNPTPTYQWSFNGQPISVATSASYNLASVQASNAGSYTVTVTNALGSVTSTGALLAVQAVGAPAITSQPQGQTIAAGSTVVLTVTSSGTVTASSVQVGAARPEAVTGTNYQWYLNGVAVAGATSATLLIPNVSAANAGSYTCLVSNSAGSSLSSAAVVTVTTTNNPGRLVNLSVLSVVQGSLTMGYVLGGSGTSGSENLLIRATGPALALAPFNVPGVMVDPTLTVVKQAGSVTLATNAGWGSNQAQVMTADSAVGAFALTNPASLDSALVIALPVSTGGYTATVAGKSGDSGYALTEVYDATATYTAATPRLVNLSCLTTISSGGTLTMGFVIGGVTAKTVLIRVSGPTLAVTPFGIAGTVPDPQLVVQPLGSSTIVAANAGWGGDPQIAAAALSVGAFAFTSPTSKDSATLLTLPAGGYTVQTSSASGGSGLVLIEVYEIP